MDVIYPFSCSLIWFLIFSGDMFVLVFSCILGFFCPWVVGGWSWMVCCPLDMVQAGFWWWWQLFYAGSCGVFPLAAFCLALHWCSCCPFCFPWSVAVHWHLVSSVLGWFGAWGWPPGFLVVPFFRHLSCFILL